MSALTMEVMHWKVCESKRRMLTHMIIWTQAKVGHYKYGHCKTEKIDNFPEKKAEVLYNHFKKMRKRYLKH